jgi:hypothetical protein
MGKNSVMKSLGKCVGNVALHKILTRHTNRPESIQHLRDEIRDYGEDSAEKARCFNWNDEEKAKIRERAIKIAENDLIKNYPDVKFNKDEVIGLVDETMQEVF